MAIRLAPFSFTAKYIEGSKNIMADYLSHEVQHQMPNIMNTQTIYKKAIAYEIDCILPVKTRLHVLHVTVN